MDNRTTSILIPIILTIKDSASQHDLPVSQI
jgi:hypothetical protein